MAKSKINKLTMFCLALHSASVAALATLPTPGSQQIPSQGQQPPPLPPNMLQEEESSFLSSELIKEQRLREECLSRLMDLGMPKANAETFIDKEQKLIEEYLSSLIDLSISKGEAAHYIGLIYYLGQLSLETEKVYNVWFDAIKKGDLDGVQKIYEKYPNIDVNRPDPETKRPPLSTALSLMRYNTPGILLAKIPLIEFLCQMPTIDLSPQGRDGCTVWHYAVVSCNLPLLKAMQKTVPEPERARRIIETTRNITLLEMLNTVNNTGYTPLDYAEKLNHTKEIKEIIQWLKNNKGDSGAASKILYDEWFKAIETGDSMEVKKLYEKHPTINVNRPDSTQSPPVVTATILRDTKLTKFLCEISTIDLSLQGPDGRTAWHWAAVSGDQEMLEAMMQAVPSNTTLRAMLNITDNTNCTSLDCANISKSAFPRIVNLLTTNGGLIATQLHQIQAQTQNAIPLQEQQIPDISAQIVIEEKSLREGCLDNLIFLGISKGNAKTFIDKVIKSTGKSLKSLMASGMTREDAKAFINEMLSLNQLSQETTKVYNVWFDAIKKGDLDSMQRIYTQYSMIDVNRSDPETKRPPLSTAALLANIPLIEFLCEMTTIDLSVQDINGRTPWHWIVIGNNLGILKLMLETVTSKRNTNWHEMLNTVDNENFTPLDYAMKYKYSEMAKLLENNGGVRGPISEAVYKNWFKAIRDRNLDGMQKIYEEYSHIDVNRSDPETNRPPLSTALHPENIPLIKFLCQIPTIDLSVQDDLGCTAWHLAAIKGDLETLESMRQVVSSGNKNWPEMLNIKNNKKLTPLDCVYALKFLCEKILSPLYRTQPHWFSADVIQIDYDRECQKHTETMQWLKENGGLTHRDWDTPAFN